MTLNRKLVVAFSIVLIFFLTLSYYELYIPYDFDEFVAYRPIGCLLFPLNRLHNFRLPCGSLDLSVLGSPFLPLRAFDYVGVTQSLFYLPLYLIWPDFLSARLLGLIALFAQALLLRSLFRFPTVITFAALVFFVPYAFQHIVDTGQLSLLNLLTLCLFVGLHRAFSIKTLNRAIPWTMLLGFLFFVGVYSRLSYLFLLPAFSLCFFILPKDLFGQNSLSRLSFFRRALLFGTFLLTFFCFFAILLASKDRNDQYFFSLITNNQSSSGLTLSLVTQRAINVGLPFLTNPLKTAHVLFIQSDSFHWTSVAYVAVICLAAIGSVFSQNQRSHFKRGLLCLSLFLTTFLTTASAERSWAMHHFVLAFPFLVLAFCYFVHQLRPKGLNSLIFISFMVIGGVQYRELSQLDSYNNGKRGFPLKMRELNAFINQYARSHYITVVGYGFSHAKSLYGPSGMAVAYTHHLSSAEDLKKTEELASSIARPNLYVVRGTKNRDFLLSNSPVLQEVRPPFDTSNWYIVLEGQEEESVIQELK